MTTDRSEFKAARDAGLRKRHQRRLEHNQGEPMTDIDHRDHDHAACYHCQVADAIEHVFSGRYLHGDLVLLGMTEEQARAAHRARCVLRGVEENPR